MITLGWIPGISTWPLLAPGFKEARLDQRFRQLAFTCLVLATLACGGTKNVATCAAGKTTGICSQQTPDERAQAKLNSGDYDGAITELGDLIAAEPATYSRLPILAAAYAARAGLNILTVAKSNFSGGGSIVDAFSAFIPTPKTVGKAAYKTHVTDMQSAVAALKKIPAALLATTSASAYASSASLQQTIYTAAYGVMFLNEFAISSDTGKLDQTQLATMSESDADAIINNFASTGQIPAVGATAAVQAQITATLVKINAEPGATNKEKIAAYMASQKSAS